MTNGPAATVGEILDVNLERPRDRVAMSETPEYIRCRKAVLSFLYERHGKKAEEVAPVETVEESAAPTLVDVSKDVSSAA
jgi:nitrate/nitrite transport system ATP-binding protein